MLTKLVPRLQDGGPMKVKTPLQNNSQFVNSSLYEQQLLKNRNAQTPPMQPIQPLQGNIPTQALDFKTLAPMKPPAVPGSGMSAGAVGSIAQGVADLGVAGIDAFSKAPGSDEFGTVKPENDGAAIAKSTLKSAGKGAALGATVGSVIPVVGTGIGALAGGLIGAGIGFFKGKKDQKAANADYETNHSANYGKFYGNQYANQFAAMQGKNGMKMKTAHIMSAVTPSPTLIPKMKHGGSINVIASGKLHKENNNLGNGDKGIPVVNKKGKKIFELEKEEWILNLAATKRAEELVNNYNKQNDDSVLEELGRLVHSELTTNTQDNSDKFGLEV